MTATVPEQVFDQALESAFDVLAKCEERNCRAPAACFVDYECGHSGLLCTAHVEQLKRVIATSLREGVGLKCAVDYAPINPEHITIRNA